MKRTLAVFFLFGFALYAQFGGIMNRAKSKIEQSRQKAAPVTDRAERAVETYAGWSPEEEQKIGEATAAKMIAMFGVIENPALVKYVNLVGRCVAQFAPRQLPYRFGILDSDIVGAFALPGGYIFITRTALEGMTSEAQLAGALGHEITHAAERHLEASVRSKRSTAWAADEAKAKTQGMTPDYISSRADALLRDMFMTSLSRDKETASDEHGTAMAAQAGYAPAGLLEFLKTLAEVNGKAENKRAFGQLLSTHPPFEDRIANLAPFVEKQAGGGKTLETRFRAVVK